MKELENLIISALSVYQNPEIVKDLVEFQKELNKKIDKSFKESLKKENIKIACEKGCDYCCYGWEVKGNISEMILVITELNSLKTEKKREIFQKLKNYPKNENLQNVPCPFLDLKTKTCNIYSSRPFVCRLYVSENVEKCKNKEEIIFPKSVEHTTKNVKIPTEETVSDEFKSLFDIKISITSILFNEEKDLFFLNIGNTINLYPFFKNGKLEISIEKGEYLKKFEKDIS